MYSCRDVWSASYSLGLEIIKVTATRFSQVASLKDASNGPGSQCQLCCFGAV